LEEEFEGCGANRANRFGSSFKSEPFLKGVRRWGKGKEEYRETTDFGREIVFNIGFVADGDADDDIFRKIH